MDGISFMSILPDQPSCYRTMRVVRSSLFHVVKSEVLTGLQMFLRRREM